MYDRQIWAWDRSRPLGYFPCLYEAMDRLMYGSGQTYSSYRQSVIIRGPMSYAHFKPQDVNAPVAVEKVEIIRCGPDRISFASKEDQETFARLHFAA